MDNIKVFFIIYLSALLVGILAMTLLFGILCKKAYSLLSMG